MLDDLAESQQLYKEAKHAAEVARDRLNNAKRNCLVTIGEVMDAADKLVGCENDRKFRVGMILQCAVDEILIGRLGDK